MFTLIATVLGGLGLFLLGMRLMTEGLKLAAGHHLKDILRNWTDTRLKGLFSGIFVTAIVQSSSATTVATIGFVNAGLLSIGQAVTVIYGTNIGTTGTAWLIALIGFEFNVKALALPMIGIGMLIKAFNHTSRIGAFGEAFAGFGVFFLGIDILRSGFEGIGEVMNTDLLAQSGPGSSLLLVFLGALLTFFMQSSSAALAIILTAASGGVVPMQSAAVLVIGANMGTTTTAALATIGATPNAKRVAAGHMLFNLVTGVVALILLPLLLMILYQTRSFFGFDTVTSTMLALFHSMFNILGVCLFWPVTPRLVKFLEARFKTKEEDSAQPRYLDKNLVSTPALGLEAIKLELIRVDDFINAYTVSALQSIPARRGKLESFELSTGTLLDDINSYINLLRENPLTNELSTKITTVMGASRYYRAAVARLHQLAKIEAKESVLLHEKTSSAVVEYHELVKHFLASATASTREERTKIRSAYEKLKVQLFELHSKNDVSSGSIIRGIDYLDLLNSFTREMDKARESLHQLEHIELLEPFEDVEKVSE